MRNNGLLSLCTPESLSRAERFIHQIQDHSGFISWVHDFSPALAGLYSSLVINAAASQGEDAAKSLSSGIATATHLLAIVYGLSLADEKGRRGEMGALLAEAAELLESHSHISNRVYDNLRQVQDWLREKDEEDEKRNGQC